MDPVAFDRNHYCIDATFYYRIIADAVIGCSRPVTLYGVAMFSKRAVLCGEESKAHIFTSNTRLGCPDGPTRVSANLPTAVVEVIDTNSQGMRIGRKETESYIFTVKFLFDALPCELTVDN